MGSKSHQLPIIFWRFFSFKSELSHLHGKIKYLGKRLLLSHRGIESHRQLQMSHRQLKAITRESQATTNKSQTTIDESQISHRQLQTIHKRVQANKNRQQDGSSMTTNSSKKSH